MTEASGRAVPPPKPGAWAQAAELGFRALFAVVVLLALGWAASNIREIPADGRAVVLRFGNVARVEGPGLLIAWPQPIEEVVLVPSPNQQIAFDIDAFDGASPVPEPPPVAPPDDFDPSSAEAPPAGAMGELPDDFDQALLDAQDSAGASDDYDQPPIMDDQLLSDYGEDALGSDPSWGGPPPGDEIGEDYDRYVPPGAPPLPDIGNDTRENAGFLLTGDFGIARLRATVFYSVSDPAAYLLAAGRIEPALRRLFATSAVAVCAERGLDDLVTARAGPDDAAAGGEAADGRARLRDDIVAAINGRLGGLARDGSGLGITVTRIDLTIALPASAGPVFENVLAAEQEAEATIARTRTYAAQAAQAAVQYEDRLLREAAAAASERVDRARARTATVVALAESRTREPASVLLQRLYFQRIGALLGKAADVTTVGASGARRLIVPGDGP